VLLSVSPFEYSSLYTLYADSIAFKFFSACPFSSEELIRISHDLYVGLPASSQIVFMASSFVLTILTIDTFSSSFLFEISFSLGQNTKNLKIFIGLKRFDQCHQFVLYKSSHL
jgi:hypothetical protein